MTKNENGAAALPPLLPPEAVLGQITMGCFLSQAVYVAAKLGIADLLKDKPVHVSELAKQTETHERSLYRVLRALASVVLSQGTQSERRAHGWRQRRAPTGAVRPLPPSR